MSTDFIAFCRAPSAAPVAASATREARSGSQHCGGGAGGGGGEYGGRGGGRSTRSGAWAGSAGVQRRQCHWSTTGGTSVCSTASFGVSVFSGVVRTPPCPAQKASASSACTGSAGAPLL